MLKKSGANGRRPNFHRFLCSRLESRKAVLGYSARADASVQWFVFDHLGDDAGNVVVRFGGVEYAGRRPGVSAAFEAGEQGAQVNPAVVIKNTASGADGYLLLIGRIKANF